LIDIINKDKYYQWAHINEYFLKKLTTIRQMSCFVIRLHDKSLSFKETLRNYDWMCTRKLYSFPKCVYVNFIVLLGNKCLEN